MTLSIADIMMAGVMGTVAMSVAMGLVSFSWNATWDMVRAVGSLFTKRYKDSFTTGLMLHLLTGIFFAFVYTSVWQIFHFQTAASYLLAGLITGFSHGFMMSFVLTIAVAEHHPIARFRVIGYGVAVSYIVGHTIYGTVVGMVIGAII